MKERPDKSVETLNYARQGYPGSLIGRDNPRILRSISVVLAVIVLLPFLIGALLILYMLIT